MELQLTVLGRDPASESRLVMEIRAALAPLVEATVRAASDSTQWGQVLFVEQGVDHVEKLLAGLDRGGRAVFLVMEDRGGDPELPKVFVEGQVDDVLLRPLRPLEVLSKIRHYQQLLMWDEVTRLNESFKGLIDRLHDDLKLAERLQKSKLPARFPEVKGFKIASRYLAGMKSGGDHFDLAESQDGNLLSVVLSDSSTYGLSSNVLAVLMRVAMKLSANEARSCEDTVRKIHEELALTLGAKDKLSLFYGVLSRKDYRLRYLNLGTSMAFYGMPGKGFEPLQAHGQLITQTSGMPAVVETELRLEPGGRLILLSDGFVEAAGGLAETVALLTRFREREPSDLLNELVFAVKSKFTEPDDMPQQDCTGAIFDVDARIIRQIT